MKDTGRHEESGEAVRTSQEKARNNQTAPDLPGTNGSGDDSEESSFVFESERDRRHRCMQAVSLTWENGKLQRGKNESIFPN